MNNKKFNIFFIFKNMKEIKKNLNVVLFKTPIITSPFYHFIPWNALLYSL